MSNAANAYARTAQQSSSPRDIEAQTLLMAARKLVEVQQDCNKADKRFHAALLFNRRLWTIFMSAAENNDNPQPVEIRQNIRNIAMNAAFLAAQVGQPVQMRHLCDAARIEYTKLERTLAEAEIGGWV